MRARSLDNVQGRLAFTSNPRVLPVFRSPVHTTACPNTKCPPGSLTVHPMR